MAEVVFSFQTDSEIVKQAFAQLDNYLIVDDPECKSDLCVIYFSSNDLYFPNNEASFKHTVLDANRFEWVRNKFKNASRHIFIRDIQKQWYLGGINARLNSVEKVFDWLKSQTLGYRVFTVGSSAGGYAGLLFGYMLNAERVYSFNPQLSLIPILNESTEAINPVIHRNRNTASISRFYLLDNVLKPGVDYFYFLSMYSKEDLEQFESFRNKHLLNIVKSKTGKHGFPFLKSNISYLFGLKREELINLSNRPVHPFLFSIHAVGLMDTVTFLIKEVIRYSLVKFKRTFIHDR